ncbi:hypothetical protein [Leptodesmis sp.]|uniref:hypothetical protein n=1 Tax=Leptodesmis sp. TaxID=3100501 RepID=UPI0040534AF8
MAYSDFTSLVKVKRGLGLAIHDVPRLFADVPAIIVPSRLQEILDENHELAVAISTKKARSELVVTPILLEVRRICKNRIGFFSGIDFSVDPNLGLTGACDYLLTASAEQSLVTAPVMSLVEAKNDLLNNLRPQPLSVHHSLGSSPFKLVHCSAPLVNWSE